jgi:hypothetical protein
VTSLLWATHTKLSRLPCSWVAAGECQGKHCSDPAREEEEGSNPHPLLSLPWRAQELKIYFVPLLDPNQGTQWPDPNPNPNFLDLYAVRVLYLKSGRLLPVYPAPKCLCCM